MNASPAGQVMLINGAENPVASFQPLDHMQPVPYEVIRLMKGTYLFLEDHLERLAGTLSLAGNELPVSTALLSRQLLHLAALNGITEGNVRIDIVSGKPQPVVNMYFFPHAYPAPADYAEGVKTILVKAVRANPNAKLMHSGFRKEVQKAISAQGAYEAILCNSKQELTEGSKSNIFAVHDGFVLTPPAGEVLKGITRKYIIEVCHQLNLPVKEIPIPVELISALDAFFITGTSPRVLPVHSIDNYRLPVGNPWMRQIMDSYNAVIEQYIDSHKPVQ